MLVRLSRFPILGFEGWETSSLDGSPYSSKNICSYVLGAEVSRFSDSSGRSTRFARGLLLVIEGPFPNGLLVILDPENGLLSG